MKMKVYIVSVEASTDFEPSGSIKVFANRKDAEDNFSEEVSAAIVDAGESWEVEFRDGYYAIYDDGRYAENHILVRLLEEEVR